MFARRFGEVFTRDNVAKFGCFAGVGIFGLIADPCDSVILTAMKNNDPKAADDARADSIGNILAIAPGAGGVVKGAILMAARGTGKRSGGGGLMKSQKDEALALAISKTSLDRLAEKAVQGARPSVRRAATRISEQSYLAGTRPLLRVDPETLTEAVRSQANALEGLVTSLSRNPSSARANDVHGHIRSGVLIYGSRGQLQINADRLVNDALLAQTGHVLMSDGTLNIQYPMGMALTALARAGQSSGVADETIQRVAQNTLEHFQGRFKGLDRREINEHMVRELEQAVGTAEAATEALRRSP